MRCSLRALGLVAGPVFVLTLLTAACGTLLDVDAAITPAGDGGDGDGGTDGTAEGALDGIAPASDGSIGVDAGDAAASRKLVFLTTDVTMGDMRFLQAGKPTGRDAADAHCQAEADAVGLGGKFIAWLSTDGEDAIARLTDGVSWWLPNGPVVFASKAQVAMPPMLAIDVDTQGNMVDGNTVGGATVWTGTANNGTRTGAGHCADWTTDGDAAQARAGTVFSVIEWTDHTVDQLCNVASRVICFQK